MKKLIVIASVYLVSVQPVYAQVTFEAFLQGSAEVGYALQDKRSDTVASDSIAFPFVVEDIGPRYDLNLNGAVVGNTDTGLSFGAAIDAYINLDPNEEETNLDLQVFVSGTFGTLAYGDTVGAYDRVLREIDIGNTIGNTPDLAWLEHGSNNGLDSDANILRYDFVWQNLTVSASTSSRETSSDLGLGISWNRKLGDHDVSVGIAHQFNDRGLYTSEGGITKRATGISLAASNDIQGFVLNYSKFDRRFLIGPEFVDDTTDYWAASYWRSFGQARIGVNASRQRRANPEGGGFNMFSGDGYGVWLEYDINPNATFSLGHGWSKFSDYGAPVPAGNHSITAVKTSLGVIVTF